MAITVEELTIPRMQDVQHEWNRVLTEAKKLSPFLRWEWVFSWLHVFGADTTPLILGFRSNDTWLGFAPLAIRKNRFQRIVEFAGARELWPDYMDIVALPGHDELLVRSIVKHLNRRNDWDCIVLSSVAENSVLLKRCELFSLAGRVSGVAGDVCDIIRLPESGDAFLQTRYSKKKRYNLKRQRRVALENHSLVSVKVDHPSQLRSACADLMSCHAKRASQKNIVSTFSHGKAFLFFDFLFRCQKDSDWVTFYELRSNSECVGSCMGFHCQKNFFLYQTGFQPQYEKLSIGSVLMMEMIDDLCSQGCTVFDFLKGDEPYKKQWSTDVRRQYCVTVYRSGIRGKISQFYHTVRTAAKKTIGGMKAKKGRA